MWNSFLIAFGALLPILNPFGSALVFLGLVGEVPPAVYRSLARKIAINNAIFLGIFELLGSAILHFFGISLPIVQLAGGIVIAIMGWSVLNKESSEASVKDKRNQTSDIDFRHLRAQTFYPLTFPLTSGPGTLVVLLTLSARFSDPDRSVTLLGHLGLYIAVLVLSVIVYLSFAYAATITKKIPQSTAHGILRVVSFILMCIGVQIAWNGLAVLLPEVAKH